MTTAVITHVPASTAATGTHTDKRPLDQGAETFRIEEQGS